jgi:hypothetical protein
MKSTFFLSYHEAQEAARRKRLEKVSSSHHHLGSKAPTNPQAYQASLARSMTIAATKKAEMMSTEKSRAEESAWLAQRTVKYQRAWSKKEVPGITMHCPKGVHLLPCSCTEVKALAGGPPVMAPPPASTLVGLSAPSSGSNQAFVLQYLFEKAQYDAAGIPEASRSKRFLDDARLAEAFLLRDKRAAEAREAVAQHKRTTLGLSTRPAPPPIRPTPLSHWLGGPGTSSPPMQSMAHMLAALKQQQQQQQQQQQPLDAITTTDQDGAPQDEDYYEDEEVSGNRKKESRPLALSLEDEKEPPDPYMPAILKSLARRDMNKNWIVPSGSEYKDMMAARKASNEARKATTALAPPSSSRTGRRECCCGFDTCTFPLRPRRVRREELDTFHILALEGKELRRIRAEAGGKAMHDIACCCGRDECNWHRSQDKYLKLKEKMSKKKNPWDF